MLKNLALFIFVLFLLLAGLEACVRSLDLWRDQDWQSYNMYAPSNIDGVPYLLKPNIDGWWVHTHIASNSMGLRDTKEILEPNVTQKEGKSIFLFGDSITFSHGVDQEHTYPQQVENILSNNQNLEFAKNISIYNAGMNGFNAVDSSFLFSEVLKKTTPSLAIFLLIPNDYDTSGYINSSGQIEMEPAYVSSEFLRLVWGLNEEYVCPSDFRKVMKSETLALLDGTQKLNQSAFYNGLKKRLYSLSFIESKTGPLISLLKNKTDTCNDPIQLLKLSSCSKDMITYLNRSDAIYYSHQYQSAFNSALSRIDALANENSVPTIILHSQVPVDYKSSSENSFLQIVPIEKILGTGLLNLRQKHNLGWDPHLSITGNRVLAEGVSTLIKSSLTGETSSEKWEYNKNLPSQKTLECLSQENTKTMEAVADLFRHEIIIKKFSGINQLFGGLYPPLNHNSQSPILLAAVLKVPEEKNIYVDGIFSGSAEIEITIKFSSGTNKMGLSKIIKPGPFSISTIWPGPSSEIIDIEISCHKKNDCTSVQILRVGFGAWTDRYTMTDSASTNWKIRNWGPRETIQGKAFNAQPDGSSAIWIEIEGALEQNSWIHFDEAPLPTAQTTNQKDGNTITSLSATVSHEMLEEFWSSKDSVGISIIEMESNKKHEVGKFNFVSEPGINHE